MEEVLNKLFENDNYNLVYESLGNIFKRDDLRIQRKIQNELFIRYLKLKRNINNLYERVAIRLGSIVLTDEVLKFLIESNIDLDYKSYDIFNTPIILKYYLASVIKDKETMQLFLSKVNSSKIYFGNGNNRCYTDLCRMNIIAGNIDRALEIFEREDYKLYNKDYISDLDIIDNLKFKDIRVIDINDDDMLYQIILTIKNLQEDINTKRDILKKFIYNKKIKLFNVNSLSYIKEILGSEYLDFINYLENSKIYIFDIREGNDLYLVKVKTK